MNHVSINNIITTIMNSMKGQACLEMGNGGKMAGRKKNPEQTAATRSVFLEKSFELFEAKTIESVTMSEIAKASGYRDMTLYRYFPSKTNLVVAVATWKWEQFQNENWEQISGEEFDGMTAAEGLEYYLDSFMELYRNHRDLLKFNQYFNVYIESEETDAETIGPYQEMIGIVQQRFHGMYLKGEKDHTIRTDIQEDEMFSTTLHLMLAAVTRYAVGLVYQGGGAPERELEVLKNMLLREYTAIPAR